MSRFAKKINANGEKEDTKRSCLEG